MSLAVGVGKSSLRDSRKAGQEAARLAVENAGSSPGLVLVFASVGHEQQALLDGVVAITGDCPMAGCSGTGIITQAGSDETRFCVAVMSLGGDSIWFKTLVGLGMSAGIETAVERIVRCTKEVPQPRVLLLLPDGLKTRTAALVAAIEEQRPRDLLVLGGAAGEVLRFDRTYQYHDGRVFEDAVSAVVIGGAVELDLVVSHGCSLLPLSHTVTDGESGVVREFDHRPAWDVLREYVADRDQGFNAGTMPYLCLAQPLDAASTGDPGKDHLIRVPLGLDEVTGTLFFPGGLERGDTVVMARRDAALVAHNAVEGALQLRDRQAGRTPAFVLQFDCAGRGAALFGNATTETLIDPLQRALGKDIPWLGFHSYGEIAPVGGRTYFHQYTVALAAFYAADDRR